MTAANPSFARRFGRVTKISLVALVAWFSFAALSARAQDSKIAEGPPPPPAEDSSQPAPPPTAAHAAPVDPAFAAPAPPVEAEEPAEPVLPVLDPVGAGRSLDVGNFYLKKGNYDAAIDRFQDAAQRQPKLAKPFLLMGQAYEKKGDPASAILAYRKYLEMFRTAPDTDKVNKRIEKLETESKHETARH